jgi:Integrase zinc binding domain
LSRREGHSGHIYSAHANLFVFSEIIPQWVNDIKQSYTDDAWITTLRVKFQTPITSHHLIDYQGILRYKNWICIVNTGNWHQLLLKEVHNSAQGGHSGYDVIYHRLRHMFYWSEMKEEFTTLDHVLIANWLNLNISLLHACSNHYPFLLLLGLALG